MNSLDRRRLAPEVYLLYKRGPYLDQLPRDVPVHAFDTACPAPPRFPPGRISRLQSRHLRQVVQSRSIDIVYDRTFHMSLLTGALPSELPRVSVIVSPPSRDLPQSERRFLFFKRWLLARAYRTATQTICVSHEVADDASRYYGLPRERLTVLNNPVDIDTVRRLAALPIDSPSANALSQRTSNELHIAVVGRFTPEKGHRFALELLRELRATAQQDSTIVHMHFIGDGPLKSQLQSLVAQWDLQSLVHMHGYQTNPYPYMAACDLVLVPSRYEGFPNVAMEALALSVPLLMTNYGPTASAIAGQGNERTVLIPLDDLSLAVNLVNDRVHNPLAWQLRARAAQSWIEREHTLAPWLEKMMSLLERSVADKRRMM